MQRNISYDPRLDEYSPFLDSNYPAELTAACGLNRELQSLVFDLLLNWRAASYAGAMPYITVKSMKAFHDGYVTSPTPHVSTLRYSDAILKRLCQRTDRISSDPQLQRALQQELIVVATEVREANEAVAGAVQFPEETTWEAYLGSPPFQMSIWGIMRITFVSMYNAYEEFLVHATKLALGVGRLRTTQKDFRDLLLKVYGPEVAAAIWTSNSSLDMFRLVRHSLSHAGGRITAELRGKNLPFPVEDDRLQIHPGHVRQLYEILRGPARRICQSACFHREDTQ